MKQSTSTNNVYNIKNTFLKNKWKKMLVFKTATVEYKEPQHVMHVRQSYLVFNSTLK